jgi:hypothetical protein
MDAVERSVRIKLGDTQTTLHPLDFSDVALTPAGANRVRMAALGLLGGCMPSKVLEDFSLQQVLKLFGDMVCWDEEGGRLILCADFPAYCYCLHIPAKDWRIVTRGQSIH